MKRMIAAAIALLIALVLMPTVGPASSVSARTGDLPSHAAVLTATRQATDYYRTTLANTTVRPTNGWSWATYADGLQTLYRQVGDAQYLADGLSWGQSNGWQILTSGSINPDTMKAGKTYYDLNAIDSTASLAAMDSRMAIDLTSLPVSQYYWIDALFMGLPDWTRWAARTGDPAYLDKMDALYGWTHDLGATSSVCNGQSKSQAGLFDAAHGLWYRDCTYVGTTDPNGQPVFWARGNGWVIAAMAEVLQSLPVGDRHATKYADMLRTMAAKLVTLQGSDGFWRSSLLDAALYPQPETSGTGLITYALAYGIKAGLLDAATYQPAVAKAWQGLSTIALQPSGFVTNCQPTAAAPGAPYTALAPRTPPSGTSSGTVNADSPPFCVGAYLLAGSQVAALIPSTSTGRPVTATAQQAGNGVTRVNDGDVTTRWSAPAFPQSATIDLGGAVPIGNSMLVPYLDRPYRYRIETSTDSVNWRLVVDQTGNTARGSRLDEFSTGAVNARYVRLTVTAVDGAGTTWVSIQEFAVYPPSATAGPTVYATDSFGRTVAGGLGVADLGGGWMSSSSSSLFSVGGGTGKIKMTAAGAGPSAFLTSVSAREVDARVDVTFDKVATGAGSYFSLAVRHATDNDYRVKVKRPPTGAVTLYLTKVVDGIETTLGSPVVSGVVPTAADTLRVRLQASGTGTTTLNAKVWKAGATEPAAWQLARTDTTPALQRAGGIGVWCYLSGSATNAPVTALVDNLSALW